MNQQTTLSRVRRRRVADRDRKRAPRACDRCKARKNKCVETPAGACQRCLQVSHPCRFERDRTPPGGQAWDRAVQTPATASSSVPAASPNRVPRTAAAIIPDRRSLGPEISQARNISDGFTLEAPVSETFMWPRFLSRLRDTFCLDPDPAYEEEEDPARPQAPVPSRPQSPQGAELHRLQQAMDGFPPKNVADFILSVCIQRGTDSFYYFNQLQFTADLDDFYAHPDSRLRTDVPFVCLALAVFALGSQWTTMARPEDPGNVLSSLPGGADPGRIFYSRVRGLIGDILDRPCVRSVQAIFVLGVYLMPASANGASYIYMGQALRKALALGLHQEADEGSLGEDDKEVRRRLWWSIYSLERLLTLKLNRPRSISQDNISTQLPRPRPADAAQRFNNIQHQIANAQLVSIIDRLIEPATWSIDLKKPLPSDYEALLKSWKRALPAELRLQSVHPESASYRAVLHLHLNYYFAWIAMGKVSVITVVRDRLRSAIRPGTTAKSPQQSRDEDVEKLHLSCVKAAKKILELLECLGQTGNVARFSFSDFQGCSIATIVVLLAGILDRDAAYDARVSFGLDCLRRMAGGNVTVRKGVRFVEDLRSIADEARWKLCSLPAQGSGRLSPGSVSAKCPEYAQWEEWLAYAASGEKRADGPQHATRGVSPTGGTLPSGITTPAGPAAAALVMSSPPWEETTALQLREMSASRFAPAEDTNSNIDIDFNLPTGEFNVDEAYLIGLTRMEVLDFVNIFR